MIHPGPLPLGRFGRAPGPAVLPGLLAALRARGKKLAPALRATGVLCHPARPALPLSVSVRVPTAVRRKGAWLAGLLLVAAGPGRAAEAASVSFTAAPGSFPLVARGAAAGLWVEAGDWPGVIRAAGDLQKDVERVAGVRPELSTAGPVRGPVAVIIGTVGRSALIDRLVRGGQLDVRAIRGQWEASVRAVVAHPLPGVEQALVIAGSDKRGTIYGIYDLSAQIGVSPWYWWADVPIPRHPELAVAPGRQVEPGPVVKYRGLFLNDEAPDLTNWVRAKFGDVAPGAHPPIPPGVANYGRQFYSKLFELMLRLRANYLWPAMWDNAFNEDDPENARLADEYGIVMGTSHQEPMLRAQKEWDRRYLKTLGTWNYATQAGVLEPFWREGIRRNRAYESLVTIGLRGANDTPMAPGGPEANRALLEQIIQVQRRILADEYHRRASRVPQLWCLYKEVQDFYAAGLRAPDDVTLLWCDDNWGNLRRLPTAAERRRAGGAGIYYHFDYHGGPRSYQWLNTNPLPKIWDQMTLAHQYGADRVWIVNVGHFKGYELPLQFFLDLAWNPDRLTRDQLGAYTRAWAAQQFGPVHAPEIAAVLDGYAKLNGRRKPELLAPDTYSLVDYDEAETAITQWRALADRAEMIGGELPAEARDAYYELVEFPTKASALLNELYLDAGRNALYARQGRASTDDLAAAVRGRFQAFTDLMAHFNHDLAGGKWDHFMDQPVLGYLNWRDPPRNSLRAIPLINLTVPVPAALGVAIDGSTAAWPGAEEPPELPPFDAFNRQRRYVDVFNRGQMAFPFTATASEPWIGLSATGGTVEQDRRLGVTIDWDRAPRGSASGTITVAGAGAKVEIAVTAFNPTEVTRENLRGFVEGDGVVSMEAAHYSGRTDAGDRRWLPLPDYGHTLSGMRATAPVDAPPATPGKDAPSLQYRMYLFHPGTFDVDAIMGPTLNTIPGRAVRYAIAFDDEPPQTVTLVPATSNAQSGNLEWEKTVENNGRHSHSTHTVAQPGYHVLKLWMVDPDVVLEKLVVNTGGLRPSYLGPPESFRGGPADAAVAPVIKAPWDLTPEERQHQQALTEEDHADMMRQLGIRQLRPGANGSTAPGTPNPANYDPAKANPYPDWPELLVTKDGRQVTTPELWWKVRRPEIVEDFEREVVGRVPPNVPPVIWEVTQTVPAMVGGRAVIARRVVGHVNNAAFPAIAVDIQMAVVLPAHAAGPVPVLVMFGWGNLPGEAVPRFPGMTEPAAPPSTDQLIQAGWGYVSLNPTSVQADNGAGLTAGIIGLTNHGRRRKPDDWGALRAWAWGAGRALDYLETLPAVDARRVGIEGVSRYGKAALVTMAFDPRFAVVLVGSSGEGGAKPHRRNFGEAVENLTSSGEYHWMAGNFLQYGAAEADFGSKTANDLPVDAHELIALCAPRPTFISYGVPAKGDAHWLDHQGSFMATVAAGPAFRLLGAKDLGVTEDYRTARMPPVNTGRLDGELAWRQHDGGHEDRSNMSCFIAWADRELHRP